MKLLSKTEMIIIALILLIAVGIYLSVLVFAPKGEKTAEIYYEGKMVNRVPLDGKEFVSTIHGVKIRTNSDKTVQVVSSTCPDKICVHAGRLSIPGQSAVCLPNQVAVKVSAADDVDVVAG